MTSDEWTWKFTTRAADQFDSLDPHVQDRIISKLDEIVESEWREPDDFLEPLTGGPFSKLRVGQYRLACTLDRSGPVLEVHRIEHRSGAYTADDD
ncbi:type II toxin-antitoxin system RelE/ParE family toxin [Halomicroarcula sp. F13]|uniref:Type II toxin-antitoxin system RelE/ParE family toxin n=1 Tax=Haloarcula rubra TaxID=2487747 RepID=A0AAW4PR44_9EURY|nr:type II toxin-antitoxin system RelE/ParE family toxin [Halomicroarcula rubra]MBX0323015.1 type II toxin-antitoxin system RelE/ParE family toxin [Halomicroarcula rubra]